MADNNVIFKLLEGVGNALKARYPEFAVTIEATETSEAQADIFYVRPGIITPQTETTKRQRVSVQVIIELFVDRNGSAHEALVGVPVEMHEPLESVVLSDGVVIGGRANSALVTQDGLSMDYTYNIWAEDISDGDLMEVLTYGKDQ